MKPNTVTVAMNIDKVDYAITFDLPNKRAGIEDWHALSKRINQEVLETLAQGVSMLKGDEFGEDLLGND